MKFRKSRTNSVGRNGNIITTGVEIYDSGDNIHVYPVTSRGYSANCSVGVPKEDIPDLIKILNQMYENWK